MSIPDPRLAAASEPDLADPGLLREALAHVAPTSKEALFWYCLNVLRVPCESCGGTGSYQSYVGLTACLRCGGEGRTGYRFARTAVCPGHTAPLDIFWELWVGEVKHKLIIGNRFGGKTLLLALLEYFKMKFQKFTVSHMGAVKQQALRAREHFHRIVSVPPGSEELEGFEVGEDGEEPGKEEARFRNGAVIEWLAGTLKQASGPHPELSVLDEVDEADPAVRQRFLKTPYGQRAQFVEASTHYIQQGTISLILKDNPYLSVARFCLWETLENCTYDCDQMPLPDGTVGRCPLFETEEIQPDGTIRMVTLCGGELARRSDGHIPVPAAVARWVTADMYSRRVEFLCEKPGGPIGGKAYWAYRDEVETGNVLPWNPETRPDSPLMLAMDFNPGVNMRMCSFVLQQAPPSFGQEWWILDEIVLMTSSTEEMIREFLRRYGVGGHRLVEAARDTGHMGGIWIFGDATGHARQGVAGETDYDAVLRMMRHLHGFRLMVPYGSANPPLIDRLNLSNRMLYDLQGGGGKRWVKIAPRCVEGRREFEMMPLGPDRKKDKSKRVQQRLGLSHLGDAFEYWVESMFPNGPTPNMLGVLVTGERASSKDAYGQVVLGGRRSSGGGAGGGLPSPWVSEEQERRW